MSKIISAKNLNQAISLSEKVLQREMIKSVKHILFEENKTTIHNYNESDKDKIYIPSETGKIFHKSDSFVKLVMGPYGSGKTTMCLHDIVKRSCEMPAWSNGRRRSRFAAVRNTSGELYSTTLKSWLMWFGDLGDITKRQKPLLTYEHIFNDGDGLVELELMFIALDREDDVRKIKSFEITGAYINELSEVPQAALVHLKGRVNHRYPSKSFCDSNYWSGIIADTNPPDTDHWIHEEFYQNPCSDYKLFRQPPGLLKTESGEYLYNPNCDNFEHLDRTYYTRMANGQKADFIKVFCLGEFGTVSLGKTVYPEYNHDLHSVENLDLIEGLPIHLGWDFGLTPACIVCQVSARGILHVIKEFCSEGMGIRTFAKNIVLPSLAKDFRGFKIEISSADPSGLTGDQIAEEMSCIGELNTLGIPTQGAESNIIETRLNSVRFFLTSMIDGKPAFIISRKGCPTLVKGFQKGYVYKRLRVVGEEKYEEKPNKNKYSHPHDALQYIAMDFSPSMLLESEEDKVDMNNPAMMC